MGRFTATNGQVFALKGIFTSTNLLIAVISALIVYVMFKYLRKELKLAERLQVRCQVFRTKADFNVRMESRIGRSSRFPYLNCTLKVARQCTSGLNSIISCLSSLLM
jgi:hypothetical protein